MIQKHRYALNLQLFAEAPDGTEFEIDDSDSPEYEVDGDEITVEDEPTEEVEEQREEVQHEEHEETEITDPPATDKKPKNETGNAVMAERKKWQERMKALEKKAAIADKLMKQSGLQDIEALHAQMDALEVNRHIDAGVDPQMAQYIVQQQRMLMDMERNLKRQQFDAEVKELQKDPFFADIEDYREEFEDIAARTGQSLEDVYMAKRGRIRMQEREREIEQTMTANRKKKDAARVDTSTSAAAKPKNKDYGLSADEMAIIKMAGMKPEEAAKFFAKYKKK